MSIADRDQDSIKHRDHADGATSGHPTGAPAPPLVCPSEGSGNSGVVAIYAACSRRCVVARLVAVSIRWTSRGKRLDLAAIAAGGSLEGNIAAKLMSTVAFGTAAPVLVSRVPIRSCGQHTPSLMSRDPSNENSGTPSSINGMAARPGRGGARSAPPCSQCDEGNRVSDDS